MKRRSMLGRRHSRLLQSPAAPSSTLRPPVFSTHYTQLTPEQSRGQYDNPFRTPSVNGSLSEVGANDENPWSVFKCAPNGLKSPQTVSTDHGLFRNPQGGFHRRESALKNNYNRKKGQKAAENTGGVTTDLTIKTRKFDFPVYKHQRNTATFPETDQIDGGQTVKKGFPEYNFNNLPVRTGGDVVENRSNGLSTKPIKPFELSVYKHQRNDEGTTAEAKTGGVPELKRPVIKESAPEARKPSSQHSQRGSQSPWECQDIRNLSPPWSNGLNTLNDFNLLTPQLPSRGYKQSTSNPAVAESRPVDLCNSLAYPLEATVLDNTVVQATVTPKAQLTSSSQDSKDEKLDLGSALSEVSLGVNTLELLDKHVAGAWSTTSWASRTPLQKLPEESEELEIFDQENLHPNHQDEVTIMEEASQHSDDTFLSPSQGSSSASKTSGRDMKKHLERLVELNSEIEEAEEERDSAEEKIRQLEEKIRLAVDERRAAEQKRRKLEYERKMLNYELLEEMSQAPSVFASQAPKRRKLGPPSAKKESSKKGPSFVASKILKRDFARTPIRTPRRSLANDTTLSMNTFLNPFTPKTLRKNINDQYDMIFGD